jgi:hypothetical protein
MFFMPGKSRGSTAIEHETPSSDVLGKNIGEEKSAFAATPDLESLSIRIARLDASVAIATRRSAEVEGMVAAAERWVESRLRDFSSQLQESLDVRVENIVRHLVVQLVSADEKSSCELSGAAVDGVPTKEDLEAQTSAPTVSSTHVAASKPGMKKASRRVGIKHSRKSQARVETQVAGNMTDVAATQGTSPEVPEVQKERVPEEHGSEAEPKHTMSLGSGSKPGHTSPRKRRVSSCRQQPADHAQTQPSSGSAPVATVFCSSEFKAAPTACRPLRRKHRDHAENLITKQELDLVPSSRLLLVPADGSCTQRGMDVYEHEKPPPLCDLPAALTATSILGVKEDA